MYDREFQKFLDAVEKQTKYWAFQIAAGGGCDYTIGCGIWLSPLEATTMGEAIEESKEKVHIGEQQTKEIIILETSQVRLLGAAQVIEDALRKAEERKEADREKQELAEFERLKNKFGDGTPAQGEIK